MYPNRTLCAALQEMRKCYETRNFAYLLGLIEEAQTMANRMEAALEDWSDIRRYHEKKQKLYKECKQLKQKVQDAKGETDKDGIESFEFEI